MDIRTFKSGAKIVIVGEAWGKNEAEAKRPLVGATGASLNRLLDEAEILPPGSSTQLNKAIWSKNYAQRDRIYHDAGIYLTNVFNFQPPGNKLEMLCGPRWGDLPALGSGKYLREEFVGELDRLRSELARLRPNLIIGLGATSCWFALRDSRITKLRGTIAESGHGKFIATYHPAYLMRGAAHLRPVVVADLTKAGREAEFPEIRRPKRFVYLPESLDDIESLMEKFTKAKLISIDIETKADQITCIGFGWNDNNVLVIPIFDKTKADNCYWGHNEELIVWQYIRKLCALPIPKVLQNCLYDLNFLWKQYGIPVTNVEHDTMLLHHALQPEMNKGLGFLGSIYSQEPAWKLMRARGKDTIKQGDDE